MPVITTIPQLPKNGRLYIVVGAYTQGILDASTGVIVAIAEDNGSGGRPMRRLYSGLDTTKMEKRVGWSIQHTVQSTDYTKFIAEEGLVPLPKSYLAKIKRKAGEIY